jgi:hypothetical protein
MKTPGAAGAEQATWQADGHAPPATPGGQQSRHCARSLIRF